MRDIGGMSSPDMGRGCFHKSYLFVVCSTLITCISLHTYVTRMDAFYRYRLTFFDRWTCRSPQLSTQNTWSCASTRVTVNSTQCSSNSTLSDKRILVWNPFFGLVYYGLEAEDYGFRKYNCRQPRCFLTSNKAELADVDVVLFHGFLLGGTPMPPRARPDQIFVFFLMESPLLANQYDWLSGLEDTFNLTITYMYDPDTDIVSHSGSVIPNEPGQVVSIPTVEDIRSKTKLAFWIVSNCQPLSTRDEYVKQLARYMQVDTFGKCGQKTCKKGDWSCFKRFSKDYYFNLAFENSYCDSYISEKTFRAMQEPVVPVVLGGGNYSTILPPYSYIDVRDYQSPRHLAQYLIQLSQNPHEYQQYFVWKTSLRTMDSQYARGKGFCRLCDILHNSTYAYKTKFDPKAYWDPNKYCLKDDDERTAVHLMDSPQ